MNRTIRIALIMTACGIMAMAMSACGKRGAPMQMPPASVTMGKSVKMDTPVVISAFGNTEERVSIDIIPQVSGILQKIFIKDGDVVKVGQSLFLIDPSDYEARVKQAEGMIKADKANLELARITLERNKPLSEKKLISAENYDTIKTKVKSIEAQLQMDQAALEQAKINLIRCTIKSPIDGVCSKRYMDEGNLAAAGMTRLTNVRSYDPIRVAFSVSEQYLPTIRKAMCEGKVKIEITPRGDTNNYTGTLEFMDNAVNPMTGTILLRGEVPNPEMKLWANQFADIRIYAGIAPGAVMVPEGAVQFGKRGPYMFAVTKDNKADMRLVKIGLRFNDLIQVVEGVAADETIVVLGQFMLFPGAPVMDLSKMPPPGTGAPPKAGTSGPAKTEVDKQTGKDAKAGQEKK
jgi:membrane fusion protein, multidrug efflux system